MIMLQSHTELNTSIATRSCSIFGWLTFSMSLATADYIFLRYATIWSTLCIAPSNTESNLTSIGVIHLKSFFLWFKSHSNFRSHPNFIWHLFVKWMMIMYLHVVHDRTKKRWVTRHTILTDMPWLYLWWLLSIHLMTTIGDNIILVHNQGWLLVQAPFSYKSRNNYAIRSAHTQHEHKHADQQARSCELMNFV